MKNIVLLLTLLLSTFSFAQNIKNIIIYSDNGEKFTLFINNLQQHEFPENNVLVQGLISNSYGISIIFENSDIAPLKKTMYLPDTSVEITYKIIEKKGKMKLRIVSQTSLPNFYDPNPNRTDIIFGNTPVFSQTITTTNTTINGGNNISVGVNVGGVTMNVNVNDNSNIHYTESNSLSYNSTEITNHYIMDGYSGSYGCPWPMNEMDFNEALQTIRSKEWDETKLEIAKQIISSNCLFADQVRDVAQLFEWEENKLKFAKYAYQYTYDQGNYFKVSQVFEWEDSIKELNNYISR